MYCLKTSVKISNLGKYSEFSFTTNLNDIHGKFDVITISSLFHHVVDPDKLAKTIDSLLNDGGIIIGGHEPNKNAFKNKIFFAGATLIKNMGGNISIDDVVVNDFNKLLNTRYPNAPRVTREEILQIVEYHSPLEQFDKGIDLKSGFIPKEFFESYFPEYEVQLIETYTTFFYRKWLKNHKIIQSLFKFFFNLIFREGNLFRFALRKV